MKRRLLIVLAVVCLLAVAATASLAYFTATKSVSNKFMVAGHKGGDPTPSPDEIFSITVTETDNSDGNTDPSKTTDEGNTYKDIVPGDVKVKDPKATNTGSVDAYIRAKVTFSKASQWKAIMGATSLMAMTDINTTNWQLVKTEEDSDKNTITFIYYYATVAKDPQSGADVVTGTPLAPTGEAQIFTKVSIPTFITTEQFATITDFTVDIACDAIQVANTGTIQNAFSLYDAQLAA